MKIQCEQCKIEYTIDDASIGDRGIRAQCPRCNHITTIRKSQSAIMDQARAKLDLAICVNCGKPCETNPNDPIPMCANCQALGQQTAPSNANVPNPLAGLPGFNTPVASVPGFGTSGVNFGSTQPDMPNFGATTPSMPMPGSGNVPAPPVYSPDVGDGRTWKIKKSPSGEIYGPFDRELISGWIDSDKIVPADEICRIGGPWRTAAEHEDFVALFAARYKLSPKPAAATASPSGPATPVPSQTNVSAPALTPPTPEDLGLGSDGPRGKAGEIKTSRGGAMAMAADRLGARPAARSPVPKGAFFAAGGIALVVVIGVALYLSGIGSAMRKSFTPAVPVAVEDGTDKQIAAFAHDFPGVGGTADEHVAAGRAAMLVDTVAAWQLARREFGSALSLQRSNLDALAGVAEVDALLGQYDEQTPYLKESMELATRAVERAPSVPVTNRAKAAALLASKGAANFADARNLLTSQVLVKSSGDAIAMSMLGASWRGADDAKAEEILKKASEMNAGLIRPRLELGLLYESQSRFQKAIETLKPITAKSYLAAYHTGLIGERVGRYKEAAAAYDGAAKVALADGGTRSWAEAVLASAIIQYQALDRVKEGAAQLAPVEAKLAAGELKLKPELEGKLKLHLAIVNRLIGGNENLEKSTRYANDVVAMRVGDLGPAAHFTLGLAKLRKGDFDGAAKELEEADAPGISHRVKSEVYFWQGQLKQRRGDSGAAGGKYEDSFHEDGENWRAIVAQAGMMADASDQQIGALDKMQSMAHVDPEFYDTYQRVTPFFPDPSGEILSKADRSFEKLYAARATDSRAATARGIIGYLQKNSSKARTWITTALGESDPDKGALVYSALLLEQKGGAENLKTAVERLQQVKTGEPSSFLSMVVGRCLLKLGKLDDAHASFTESLQQTPDYSPAQYWMGVELSKHGDKKGAVAKWSEALRYDPNYLRASQAIAETDG